MKKINIDGRTYNMDIYRKVSLPSDAPRLVVVSYQPNKTAAEILKVCIRSIQKFSDIPYELWVVDNNSPLENVQWLLELPDINVGLNRTTPTYPRNRHVALRLKYLLKGQRHPYEASYANAIGLEIGVRLIDPKIKYFMTLHMDTMASQHGWLSYLISKLKSGYAASGICMQNVRIPEGILHVSGYIVDFQKFLQLGLDFFPQLPEYDVGDYVSVGLRNAGHQIFACKSTYETPDLVENIPINSPLYSMLVNRSFDDNGQIIFLHLGRGIGKSTNQYQRKTRTTPDDWFQFAEDYLLSN